MTTTFEKIGSRAIPALQATVEEYISPRTGARHIHLASDQAEKVFLVAFPTVPDVSDGRAHILEHLSLCGSQRYPVRGEMYSSTVACSAGIARLPIFSKVVVIGTRFGFLVGLKAGFQSRSARVNCQAAPSTPNSMSVARRVDSAPLSR